MRINDRKNMMYVNIRDCGREFSHYVSCFESKNLKFINDSNINMFIPNEATKQKVYHSQEIIIDPSKILNNIIKDSPI